MRGLLVVVALVAVSAALRTQALGAGYWIDEAISVGIASHPLAEIPAALRQDGSPPLYYLLLHLWMGVAGSGEVATRVLSLVFALVTVPVAWWAGRAVVSARAGVTAAVVAAACPFLTYYAQETRMYSLVALLSLLAAASFVLAFVHGRRGHVIALGAWTVLLLYTHTWGVFLATGIAAVWLALWHRGEVDGRDGAWLGAAVAVLAAPWLPALLFQAAHTGAPWAQRPALGHLALALAIAGALARATAGPVRVLAGIAGVTVAAAWAFAQLEPAWSVRYLAVLYGPVLLALAAAARSGRRGVLALTVASVAAGAVVSLPPTRAKSNVRPLAAALRPPVRGGDLVVATQPEQVPVLHRYLPAGVVYLTPLGVVPDASQVDWRDALGRFHARRADAELASLLAASPPGRRVLLVTPVRSRTRAPWPRAIRSRTREWRHALRHHPGLTRLAHVPPATPRPRSTVRAELYVVDP
jgi:mannosyltransferase